MPACATHALDDCLICRRPPRPAKPRRVKPERRGRPTTRCGCGYVLFGSVGAVCPECGAVQL